LRTQTAPTVRSFNPRVTANAEAVVRRATARKPEERYFSAMELASDLQALARGSTTQALVSEGGPLRKMQRTLRAIARGDLREYKSPHTFLGLPLVHVYPGRRNAGEGARVAMGWIAVGDVAVGGVAFGGIALGLISLGGLAGGLLASGGFALGGFAFGGFAAGLAAFGGFAAGYAAIGGQVWAYYGFGGRVDAVHALTSQVRDPEAVEFFRAWIGWFEHLPGGSALVQLLR